MKFIINIEKKHFYLLVVMISVLGIFTVFAAVAFDPNAPTHPLEQIVAGGISVDADGDGKIDNANNLQGLNASAFCKSNGIDCIWTTSGSDVYYNTGNVGIGTMTPTEKLDVAGNILASGTICDSNGCIVGGVNDITISGPSGNYTWQGSGLYGQLGPHDVCFLNKVYAHDDNKDDRTQGCEIEPVAGNMWNKLVKGQGAASFCSAICLDW